jgi:hypothetical protein
MTKGKKKEPRFYKSLAALDIDGIGTIGRQYSFLGYL